MYAVSDTDLVSMGF